MKKLHLLAPALAVAIIIPCAPLCAQIVAVTDPDYTAVPLFSSSENYIVSGLASDGADRVFYMESEGVFAGGTRPTKLFSRTVSDGVAGPPQLLHDFGAFLGGTFLAYSEGRVYGGEFNTGSIFAVDAAGGNFDVLGTVQSNYDGALSGGSLFLSHYEEGSGRVTRFDLVPDPIGGGRKLAEGKRIVNTTGEFSGPVEFGKDGELFYNSASGSGGLYRFRATEVAAAAGDPDLALDAEHLLIPGAVNGYLAPAGEDALWGSSPDLRRIDTDAATSSDVASSQDALGQIDGDASIVFANVTDFNASPRRSTVYAIVPEPSALSLLVIATALGVVQRRRR